MDEELLEAIDESGNDVFILEVTPRADRGSVNGANGEAGEGTSRYFLNSMAGPELFLLDDGALKSAGSDKTYRLR